MGILDSLKNLFGGGKKEDESTEAPGGEPAVSEESTENVGSPENTQDPQNPQ